MENKNKSIIITTTVIIILNIIVYLFNKTWVNVWSIDSLIFYGNVILAILSIFLIRKSIDKYKHIIIILNIFFIVTFNIIAIYNILTIIKSNK